MSAPEERLQIDVPDKGPVSGAYARPIGARSTIVVAHGAGAGLDHPFMVGFTRGMNDEGVATLRFNFPYMEGEKKRAPDRPPVAIAAWNAAFACARSRSAGDDEPIWTSGKSFGGRMASMAVAADEPDAMPAAGLVFLGYPLHPPGKPDRVRDEHLYEIGVPMLFLQGTRDPFATPEVLRLVIEKLGANATLKPIEGGGHSFEVRGAKRDPREVAASLAPIVAVFMREHGGA
jgi:predicted alpha/beta-hydrolase family hydrolase